MLVTHSVAGGATQGKINFPRQKIETGHLNNTNLPPVRTAAQLTLYIYEKIIQQSTFLLD
jgi:hypothetical protein